MRAESVLRMETETRVVVVSRTTRGGHQVFQMSVTNRHSVELIEQQMVPTLRTALALGIKAATGQEFRP